MAYSALSSVRSSVAINRDHHSLPKSAFKFNSFTCKIGRFKRVTTSYLQKQGTYTATIVSVEKIVAPQAPGGTCHIVIDHAGNVPYWEGQSYGIIPPGENPKKPGNPHNVRLYSIASTRYGDFFNGKAASLCVRRAIYYDPKTGKEDLSKNGVCSNFLCDSKPGDRVQITGPSGKIMLLPEDNPNSTHIMIGTGTGVAPFRGYLRRMFTENVPAFKFGGLAWLFLGWQTEGPFGVRYEENPARGLL